MPKAKIVVRVSTSEERSCPLCGEDLDGIRRWEDSCQHLLREHGLKVVHVGQESCHSDEGLFHSTVAVFVG